MILRVLVTAVAVVGVGYARAALIDPMLADGGAASAILPIAITIGTGVVAWRLTRSL